MSKTFRIGVYEEQSGSVVVTADKVEEARAKVELILEEEGLEGLKDFKIMDRSYGVSYYGDFEG